MKFGPGVEGTGRATIEARLLTMMHLRDDDCVNIVPGLA